MQRPNDLAFIRPDVPYEQLAGVDSQDLVPMINEYIMRTSDLLNSFVHRFQRKIDEVEQRMGSIDIMIQLLEKKLERVKVGNKPQTKPEHKTGSVNAEEQQLTAADMNDDDILQKDKQEPKQGSDKDGEFHGDGLRKGHSEGGLRVGQTEVDSVSMGNDEGEIGGKEEKGEETNTPEGMVKVKDHPAYSKYFKMVRVGIPEMAVAQKMNSEGVNGAFLATPEALIPLE
ncbi:unnamed protein product [Bursaphelenchus okinawaensis]|uniref:Uncharacterized protein n=1 Tax=Bursaphelenchus okinawaensis TaxID=465554 RepID=A0A811K430_9BILA|nr:unnamed protein product [Bursaphelenchus okinawaensis]CAG9090959.1 unnamed protein product [Bursaphelenchus okinawaensis]